MIKPFKTSKNTVKGTAICLLLLGLSFGSIAQKTLDSPISKKKMLSDLELFRSIRAAANSGVYKYRTTHELDSVYQWALEETQRARTFREFYNILWTITDFEGSLHNGIYMPPKIKAAMRAEPAGYFPLTLKVIKDQFLVNMKDAAIPPGARILSVNGVSCKNLFKVLGRFYTTDGYNLTGKEIGLSANFATYYRLVFGLKNSFQITYQQVDSEIIQEMDLESVSYLSTRKAFLLRHSKAFDSLSYEGDEEIPYHFQKIDEQTGALRISSFSIGWNENHPKHKAYVLFLDSVFQEIKSSNLQNLIVDVRPNGGGSDPNDLVTYSYLTNRSFSENKEAWVSFKSPPYWKHNKEVRLIGKFLEKRAYRKIVAEDFPEARNGRFYQNETSDDHLIRKPHELAFKGNIYLLVSPRTASAGSLFAAMVAGNENTTVIGRETQGGYYGHNGHVPIRYRLPHSKIKFMFSIVNLEQDVPPKTNQPKGRGIMPDYEVTQSITDFIENRDTVWEFTLDLIESKRSKTPDLELPR